MDIIIRPRKLFGSVEAIPSKSHAHRVLIAQKLSELQSGKKSLHEIKAFSEDIEATINCLNAFNHIENTINLNCGESGSTLRFLLPVAMALTDNVVFYGKGKLPQRPLSPLKEELELHGCRFANSEGAICQVTGSLTSGKYTLPGNVSSQFITGLLFALSLLKEDSTIKLTTVLESAGYVQLTLKVLKDFGITVITSKDENGFDIFKVPGGQIYKEPKQLSIEGDWSNAAVWLVCGALGGNITCTGLDINSAQKDKEIVRILRDMGAKITVDKDGVSCMGDALNGITEKVSQYPDLVPVMAAAMAGAKGPSLITEGQRLRIKESDRISSLCHLLSALGSEAIELDDGIKITGNAQLNGGTIASHNDHRIVMAAAAASCCSKNAVIIKNAEAIAKSYPNFFEDFVKLGGSINKEKP